MNPSIFKSKKENTIVAALGMIMNNTSFYEGQDMVLYRILGGHQILSKDCPSFYEEFVHCDTDGNPIDTPHVITPLESLLGIKENENGK